MYEAFFGFTTKPFSMTPDPAFLFLSESHKEALANLQYGLLDNKGFVVLVGEVGTGKTLLLRKLLGSLPDGTEAAYLFCPRMSFADLLRYLLSEFNLEAPPSATDAQLLTNLYEYLIAQHATGASNLLIIDEAQNMEVSLLENIRMLSNLETASEKLIQIILAGQPELESLLARPELRQLRQRISLKAIIDPLTEEETGKYVRYRLRVAGTGNEKIFRQDGIRKIYQYTRGIPRAINILCDNALLIGYATERKTITQKIVQEAIQDLERKAVRLDTPGRKRRVGILLGVLLACMLLIGIGAASVLYLPGYLGQNLPGLSPSPVAGLPSTPTPTETPTLLPPPETPTNTPSPQPSNTPVPEPPTPFDSPIPVAVPSGEPPVPTATATFSPSQTETHRPTSTWTWTDTASPTSTFTPPPTSTQTPRRIPIHELYAPSRSTDTGEQE